MTDKKKPGVRPDPFLMPFEEAVQRGRTGQHDRWRCARRHRHAGRRGLVREETVAAVALTPAPLPEGEG